jgi:hypothetical protein
MEDAMANRINPVLAMLKEDHKKVKGLFEEYERDSTETTRDCRHRHA